MLSFSYPEFVYTCDEGIVLRSTYHVFDAYVNYMESEFVDAWDTDSIETFHVVGTKGGKDVTCLDAVVTANEDGSKISAAIVNKHAAEAKDVTLTLASAPAKYRLIEVSAPGKDSYNDLNHTDVTLTEHEWVTNPGTNITVTLKPHSVNVIQVVM